MNHVCRFAMAFVAPAVRWLAHVHALRLFGLGHIGICKATLLAQPACLCPFGLLILAPHVATRGLNPLSSTVSQMAQCPGDTEKTDGKKSYDVLHRRDSV